MDIHATRATLTRAAKAYRHAKRSLEAAETDRSRARHARRMRNAQRLEAEARQDFEAMAMETA